MIAKDLLLHDSASVDCPAALEPWQNVTFIVTGFITIFLLLINLAFIAYNIVKFLIPLKIKSWLLLVFYALATIMLVARVIELFYMIIPTDRRCYSLTSVDG